MLSLNSCCSLQWEWITKNRKQARGWTGSFLKIKPTELWKLFVSSKAHYRMNIYCDLFKIRAYNISPWTDIWSQGTGVRVGVAPRGCPLLFFLSFSCGVWVEGGGREGGGGVKRYSWKFTKGHLNWRPVMWVGDSNDGSFTYQNWGFLIWHEGEGLLFGSVRQSLYKI